MNSNQVIKFLHTKSNHKIDLYFYSNKIESYYQDLGFPDSEITITESEGGEVTGGLFNFINAKATDGNSFSDKTTLNSRGKAKVILENHKLNIEGNNESLDKNLVYFSGNGDFTIGNNTFNLLDENSNNLIDQERKAQEEIMEEKSFIFSYTSDNLNHISIAKKAKFYLESLSTYRLISPYGILGLKERHLTDSIILVNPLWIWKEL